MSNQARARNAVYVIDGGNETRAAQFRRHLEEMLPLRARERFDFKDFIYCRQVLEAAPPAETFEERACFVFIHEGNRYLRTSRESREAFLRIENHCRKEGIPIVYTTGSPFPNGVDEGIHGLLADKLIVSYPQFLEKFGHTLIERWMGGTWDIGSAAEMVIRLVAAGRRVTNPVSVFTPCDLVAQGCSDFGEGWRRTAAQSQESPAVEPRSEAAGSPTLSAFLEGCRRNLDEAFTQDTDKSLELFIDQYLPHFRPNKWLIRCLYSTHSRESAMRWWGLSEDEKAREPGALRLFVEVVRGDDAEMLAGTPWANRSTLDDPPTVEATLGLASDAHEEFLRAWAYASACSQSSFESVREELHHDKLKNKFLPKVGYNPAEPDDPRRAGIMREALQGNAPSVDLLRMGSRIWKKLSPQLSEFFDTLDSRYGFVFSDAYLLEHAQVVEALRDIDSIMNRVDAGEFDAGDVGLFWRAADRIRLLLGDLAKSRRFGDYVIDLDPILLGEKRSG